MFLKVVSPFIARHIMATAVFAICLSSQVAFMFALTLIQNKFLIFFHYGHTVFLIGALMLSLTLMLHKL